MSELDIPTTIYKVESGFRLYLATIATNRDDTYHQIGVLKYVNLVTSIDSTTSSDRCYFTYPNEADGYQYRTTGELGLYEDTEPESGNPYVANNNEVNWGVASAPWDDINYVLYSQVNRPAYALYYSTRALLYYVYPAISIQAGTYVLLSAQDFVFKFVSQEPPSYPPSYLA